MCSSSLLCLSSGDLFSLSVWVSPFYSYSIITKLFQAQQPKLTAGLMSTRLKAKVNNHPASLVVMSGQIEFLRSELLQMPHEAGWAPIPDTDWEFIPQPGLGSCTKLFRCYRNNNWFVQRQSCDQGPGRGEVPHTALEADQVRTEVTRGMCQILPRWSVPGDRQCGRLYWGVELHDRQDQEGFKIPGPGRVFLFSFCI